MDGSRILRKAGSLDRHAMILHGMLQEAKQKAEAMKASMGAQVRRQKISKRQSKIHLLQFLEHGQQDS